METRQAAPKKSAGLDHVQNLMPTMDDADDADEAGRRPFFSSESLEESLNEGPQRNNVKRQPVCSVLNTVIDHIMIKPTPLEPQEFEESAITQGEKTETPTQPLRVPVLRVFGPILRRDTCRKKAVLDAPSQSACLYIHGAWPYLLARPIRAGPDGSLHHGSSCRGRNNSLLEGHVHVDWDNPQAIQNMLPVLQEHLEKALQEQLASMSIPAGKDSTSKQPGEKSKDQENRSDGLETGPRAKTSLAPNRPTAKPVSARVIRSLSVVVGRGFYSFCAGPPAPFVRVEYFDPSHRWRVKRVLERGLEMPPLYHPNPYQYDLGYFSARRLDREKQAIKAKDGEAENDDDDEQSEADIQQSIDDLLQFNCYEAHIPYTMQFFKDWNLSGMQYIDVELPLFRGERLPTWLRPSPIPCPKLSHSTINSEGKVVQAAVDTRMLFLESNTPRESRWCHYYASTDSQKLWGSPESAAASTATEMETDALPHQEMPSSQESTDEAMLGETRSPESQGPRPSILEEEQPPTPQTPIFSSRLLHPPPNKETKCDVELDVHVNQILNVDNVIKDLPKEEENAEKEIFWRAVPSLRDVWGDEARRMAKLLSPEDDFLNHHRRPSDSDMTELMERAESKPGSKPGAKLALEGMQRLFSDGMEENFRRVMSDIVRRYAKDIDQVDNMLMYPGSGGVNSDGMHENPQAPDNAQHSGQTPSEEETLEALFALGEAFAPSQAEPSRISQLEPSQMGKYSQSSKANTQFSQSQGQALAGERFRSSTRHYYAASAVRCNVDESILTQRIDRGDSLIDGPFEHVEDFIDPTTLLPYELIDSDDEDNAETDESALEQNMSILASQTFSQGFAQEDTDEGDEDEDEAIASDEVRQMSILLEDEEDGSKASSEDSYVTERDFSAKKNPPSRKEMVNLATKTRLHLLPIKGRLPTWLRHASSYETMRKACGKSIEKEDWFPAYGEEGLTLHLSRSAPRRQDVESWLSRRLRKRPLSILKAFVFSNSKRSKGKNTSANLEIDSNSRKLVVAGNLLNGPGAVDDVEEVEWQASQSALQMHKEVDEQGGSPTSNRDSLKEKNNSQTTESKGSQSSINFNSDPQALRLRPDVGVSCTLSRSTPESSNPLSSDVASPGKPLESMGNQGGRLWIGGGGELKAKVRPTQNRSQKDPKEFAHRGDSVNDPKTQYLPSSVSVMVIEVHVQCRTGRAGVNDSKQIALTPDSDKDKVSAIVYVYGKDPGGGEPLTVLERGCIFVPTGKELADMSNEETKPFSKKADDLRRSLPEQILGVSPPMFVQCVENERNLLLRLSSLVHMKDPDCLLSWDTQGAGLGYLVERGASIGATDRANEGSRIELRKLDMVMLLGRTLLKREEGGGSAMEVAFRKIDETKTSGGDGNEAQNNGRGDWKGSGLGSDWDERVGAGAAAASISGRLVFAAWKLVAEEVKHPNASYLQAVVWAILNRRIPYHNNMTLSKWYGQDTGRERWRVLHYRMVEATASLLLFDALDIIGRAGEAARLSGVEFSQSFPGIRGSQYKVEGVLLRSLQSLVSSERGSKRGVANNTPSTSLSNESKSQTQSPWKARRRPSKQTAGIVPDDGQPLLDLSDRAYFFYSPSFDDSNRQEALEVQALTLEPQSGHYKDPVVVCDFTALYPSLVIAYNLCYSTCAGRFDYQCTRSEMRRQGVTTGKVGPFLYAEGRTATVLKHHVKSLSNDRSGRDRAYVAPTGTIYVSEDVVKGVLPQVLDEMLSTRAMLKKAAKVYKKNVKDLSPSILRQLEARQLALKYVANVTYGYTSATFSGRCAMPLLADTIVELGRRTLMNAINLANEWGQDRNSKWYGCKVLYGDTDSVFVHLPRRSVEEAFDFGEEFCRAVTAKNPPPVQLKLEKVYLGSILQTKKKYCGMKFESREQLRPEFEAKGLETIRRDQCALTQKILRNSLIMLFSKGIGAVKTYMFRQWDRILSRRVKMSDFILTGRVRSRYRGGGVGPVQAVLARRLAEADPAWKVKHKERLAFVLAAAPGQSVLRDGVYTPMELLEQWDAFVINSAYYITKHVNPALNRCLSLAPHNANVNDWYAVCPKPRLRVHFWPITVTGTTLMVSSYFGCGICALCGGKGKAQDQSRIALCDDCKQDDLRAMSSAMSKLNLVQHESHAAALRCARCNLGYEDASTFATMRPMKQKKSTNTAYWGAGQTGGITTPIASCSCIDCPVTFERHRLREAELEAMEVCRALGAEEESA